MRKMELNWIPPEKLNHEGYLGAALVIVGSIFVLRSKSKLKVSS